MNLNEPQWTSLSNFSRPQSGMLTQISGGSESP
jgi:hypothetical protein